MAMLDLVITPAIKDTLQEAAASNTVSEDSRQLAVKCLRCKAGTVPWALLKRIVADLRHGQRDVSGGLWLQDLCRGSAIALHPPSARAPPTRAFAARLARLRDEQDNREYAAMVADVTVKERDAEERRNSLLPTLRLQMSFAAHVIVTMGTFYAAGFYGSRMLLDVSMTTAVFVGTLGLMFALLLETTLLIIRSNRPTPLEERFPDLVDTDKFNAAMKREHDQQQQLAGLQGKQQQQKLVHATPTTSSSSASSATAGRRRGSAGRKKGD